MSLEPACPPRLARALLKLAYGGERGEVLIGDLEEQFQRLQRSSRWRARRWYWSQALGSIGVEIARRARTLAPGAKVVADIAESRHAPFGDTLAGRGRAEMIGNTLRDVRLAARSLMRRPAFAFMVVAILALGIGATIAIFSVADAVLLNPLPYRNPDRLVNLWETVDRQGQTQNASVAFANLQDWKAGTSTMANLAGVRYRTVVVGAADQTVRAPAAFVDPGYFPVFGVAPLHGRVFGVQDHQSPGAHRIVVISYAFWQRVYGGAAGLLGADIQLDGTTYQLVGILPADFQDPFDAPGTAVDVWLPLMQMGMVDQYPREIFEQRRFTRLVVFGRLAPEASLEQAAAEFDAIAQRLASADADVRGRGIVIDPLAGTLNRTLRTPVEILLAGAVMLFVLACVNVANLVTARSLSRQRETALRKALGAGWLDVVRPVIVEGLLLGLLAGVIGLGIAALGLPALLRLNPTLLPGIAHPRIDGTTALAAAFLSLFASAAMSAVPVWRALRAKPATGGDALDRGLVRSPSTARPLVVLEVATALVLLVGSSLLVRSLRTLQDFDPGFDADGILAVQLDLPRARFSGAPAASRFFDEVLTSVRAIPGVRWAGFWGPGRPLISVQLQSSVPEGTVLTSMADAELGRLHAVDPGELEQLGIHLIRGRDFTEQDRPSTPPVAIVSEALGERLWPGEGPVGKRFGRFVAPGQDRSLVPLYEVVGVVANARLGGRVSPSVAVAPGADFYLANAQYPELNSALLVKTDGDPAVLADPVREAIASVDRNVPVYNVWPLHQDLAGEEAPARFAAVLMTLLGGLALCLAGMGVYGLLAYSVALRSREIGLRTALGARARDNVLMFVKDGLRLAVAGVLVGLAAAFFLVRFIESVLFGVATSDPASWIVASLVLLATAGLACYLPAVRAAATDVVDVLRAA